MLWGIFEYISSLLFFFLHVTSSGSFPKALTKAEEARCLERMAAGDKAARQKLIEHNLRLVAHIAKKYFTDENDRDDLVSIGTIGLIKAVDSFRPDRGIRLSSYASRCIENEILMFFRGAKKTAQNISLNEPIDTDKDGNTLTLLAGCTTCSGACSRRAKGRSSCCATAFRASARSCSARSPSGCTSRAATSRGSRSGRSKSCAPSSATRITFRDSAGSPRGKPARSARPCARRRRRPSEIPARSAAFWRTCRAARRP